MWRVVGDWGPVLRWLWCAANLDDGTQLRLPLVPLLAATLIWAGVIVFTIGMLVPINDRIASLNTMAPMPGWKQDHKKWDSLHRVRILLLAVAFLALAYALVA